MNDELGTEVDHAYGEEGQQKEPAHGILGSAGGQDGAHAHIDYDERVVEPPVEEVSVWV